VGRDAEALAQTDRTSVSRASVLVTLPALTSHASIPGRPAAFRVPTANRLAVGENARASVVAMGKPVNGRRVVKSHSATWSPHASRRGEDTRALPPPRTSGCTGRGLSSFAVRGRRGNKKRSAPDSAVGLCCQYTAGNGPGGGSTLDYLEVGLPECRGQGRRNLCHGGRLPVESLREFAYRSATLRGAELSVIAAARSRASSRRGRTRSDFRRGPPGGWRPRGSRACSCRCWWR